MVAAEFILSFDVPMAKLEEMFGDSTATTEHEMDETYIAKSIIEVSSEDFSNAEDPDQDDASAAATTFQPAQPAFTNTATNPAGSLASTTQQPQHQAQTPELRYYCGEHECFASRKVFVEEKSQPYKYMLAHYNDKDPELWLDSSRLISVPIRQTERKSLRMRARAAHELREAKRGPKNGEELDIRGDERAKAQMESQKRKYGNFT